MDQNVLDSVYIAGELVVLDLEAVDDQDAIDKLAHHMYDRGIVKESYIDAVKEREKVFSTGLPCADFGVAIPHTDIDHVNRDAVGIAILKNPVNFKMMGTPDVEIETKMMFMLALKTPHGQLAFLSSLMEIFQEEGLLASLVNLTDKDEIASQFKKLLAK